MLCGGALIFGAINIYLKEDEIQQLHYLFEDLKIIFI